MSAPKKGAGFSQTPRAVAAREKRADARSIGSRGAKTGAPPQEPESGPGPDPSGPEAHSTESIGVVAPASQPQPEPEDEAQTYHCNNCQGPVIEGDAKCPTCELELAWPDELKAN